MSCKPGVLGENEYSQEAVRLFAPVSGVVRHSKLGGTRRGWRFGRGGSVRVCASRRSLVLAEALRAVPFLSIGRGRAEVLGHDGQYPSICSF